MGADPAHGRPAGAPALAPREDRLLRTWELRAARDFAGLQVLLAAVPDAELVAEPELGVALAEALVQSGGWNRALRLAQRLEEPCRQAGGGQLARRRLSVEGQILYARGHIAEATQVWGTMLDSAAGDGDQRGIGVALLNLGSIASVRAEWAEAMSLFARAIAVGQTLGDEPLLGIAYTNLGLTCVELGLPADADDHLRHGLRLLQSPATRYQAARADTAMALLHLHGGDLRLARWAASRSRERLAEMGFAAAEADAMRLLGMVAAAEGAFAEAAEWLRRARKRLRGGADVVTEAEVREEQAVLALRTGDPAASAGHEAAAAALYEGLHAPRRTARLRSRLADERRRQGKPGPSQESQAPQNSPAVEEAACAADVDHLRGSAAAPCGFEVDPCREGAGSDKLDR